MSEQRPTPETDAAFEAFSRGACGTVYLCAKMAELERQRDDAREELKREQQALHNAATDCFCYIDKNNKLDEELREVRCKLVEKDKQLAEAQAYANRCREGCITLSHSIDRIDYLCGEPNEMGCSDYCVHQNDEAVVERVKGKLAELEAMREAIKEAYEALETSSRSLHGSSYHKAQSALAKLKPLLP